MAATTERLSESATRAARDLQVVFSRFRRRFKEAARGQDLTPSQVAVLTRLIKTETASASEIAAAEQVRPQAVAQILAVLAERGLIQRHPDPDDGRRQLISLTTAGRAWAKDARRIGEEWLARVLQDHCTEAERQTVIKAMAVLDRLTLH